ncbi:RanBP-type and C3HC4-type zinc finger-containing protein 1 [Armadillidium vulgare]|nr:RanBP-type and C3HC4-type zinc finger-containing protein 1 [Armadillidium vulgare]
MSRSSSYKSNGNQDSESKSEISDENNKEIKHKYPSDVKIISTKITSPVLTRVVQNDRNIQIESVKDLNKKDKGKREKKVNYSKSDNEKKLGEKQHLRKYNTNTNESADVEMKEKGLPQQNFNSPSFTKDGWVCPQCTLINPKDRPGCEACTTERPESFSNPGLKKKNLRQEVFALESKGCVTNQEPFDCVVCLSRFEVGEGVILRDCLHIFCRYCLINSIRYSDRYIYIYIYSDKNYSCQFSLQEREIKDLLSEEDYKETFR